MNVQRAALNKADNRATGPFAEVIVDIPVHAVDRVFHYSVPAELSEQVVIGRRVLVPFGSRRVDGYVVGFSPVAPVERVRPLLAVRGESAYFGTDGLTLARWLAERYLALEVDALRCLAPPGTAGRSGSGREAGPRLLNGYRLNVDVAEARELVGRLAESGAGRQAAALTALLRSGDPTEPMAAVHLGRETGVSVSSLQSLARQGILAKQPVRIDRRPSPAVSLEDGKPPVLTSEQEAALELLRAERRASAPRPVLLHGVTGSGKTEVYLQIIADVLAEGLGAIVLVPEIALTPQTFARFAARFGDQVAVLHSRLSAGERFDQWEKVATGEAAVVVGARSAVFAPMHNLGLIIVDEEHETSYKQDESPRYHGRDVAVERARQVGALCVLGSATPALESYVRARDGDYALVRMSRRVDDRPMPSVEVVDMREEMLAGNRSIFSRRLRQELDHCLRHGRQALLFLNRRGHSQFVLCRECGFVVRCDDCDVSHTFHEQPAPHLRCHYCDDLQAIPAACPQCNGRYLRPFGAGTQRVEQVVQQLYPAARVQRIDLDTTSRKDAHARLFEQVRRGEVDVIVGTQMVAKGLDFPNVTLVGVIAADTTLHFPDFRAAERTFQLLTQVGGRAGRHVHEGKVVVQTYAPEHYSIEAAKNYDEAAFYEREARFRQGGDYPPYTGLVRILITSEHPQPRAAGVVAEAARRAAGSGPVAVIGPAPAPMHRLRGRYRWHVLVKGDGDGPRQTVAAAREMWLSLLKDDEATVAVDVDPMSLT